MGVLYNEVELWATRSPEKAALVCDDRVTTYRELIGRAHQIANGLIGLGIKRGARVGYLGRNSDAFFELILGLPLAGVVLAPINWRLTSPEIEYIMTDLQPEVVFVSREFMQTYLEAAKALPQRPEVICLDDEMEGVLSFGKWRSFPHARRSSTSPCRTA